LVGSIPSTIGYLNGITSLDHRMNRLTGTMISIIFELLTPISFHITLIGTFPSAIGYLTGINFLDLGSNRLTGTIE
jgi:hypothetical protein